MSKLSSRLRISFLSKPDISQQTLSGTPSLNSSFPTRQSQDRVWGRTMRLRFPSYLVRGTLSITCFHLNVVLLVLPKYPFSVDC